MENPKTSIADYNKENLPATPVRNRKKRALPTSVSPPERSPNAKNKSSIYSLKRPATLSGNQYDRRDEVEQLPNIDDIAGDKTRVKVLILWPSGETYVHVPSNEESILLVKNIALKEWKSVANTVFKHKDLQLEVFKTLWRVLNKEFKQYISSDCMLKGRSPEELIAFSNRLFVKELQVNFPAWSTCIRGACGLDMEDDDLATSIDLGEGHLNSLALTTSVIARVRNKSLSALAYRISSILLHSGTSHQEIIRLNRLGVCMSPDMILHLQSSLGENFDSKVFSWKKDIEVKQPDVQVLNLLTEIAAKQLPKTEDVEMHIDVVLDLSEETVKDYNFYNPEVFSTVKRVMESEKIQQASTELTDELLKCVIKRCKGLDIPYFK